MKNKIITLTEALVAEGFKISEIEVEADHMIRIKFEDYDELVLIVNGSFAKIENGNCGGEQLERLKRIIKKEYTIKAELESIEQDMFSKLLNAS